MSFEDEGSTPGAGVGGDSRPGAGVGRDYEEGPLSKGNMKCTDTLWLIFYLMFNSARCAPLGLHLTAQHMLAFPARPALCHTACSL